MLYFDAINWREDVPLTSVAFQCYQQQHTTVKMSAIKFACVAVILAVICLAQVSEANYKNAPMNGIMFGKRGPSDYENRAKAFTALCEIATEACQTWFPSPENK